jgi:PIN domain nuclease of toxin-antitoxin system
LKLLLDTHVFLWLQTEPERLGKHLAQVEDPRAELIVSAVVSWEIAIKYRLGHLDLPETPDRYVPARLRAIGATALAIEHTHALAVSTLPPLHRDPFDRLLVAQSKLLGVPILTADPELARYPIQTLTI